MDRAEQRMINDPVPPTKRPKVEEEPKPEVKDDNEIDLDDLI